jgi:hypothetical protein
METKIPNTSTLKLLKEVGRIGLILLMTLKGKATIKTRIYTGFFSPISLLSLHLLTPQICRKLFRL